MILNQNLTMLRLDEGPGQSAAGHGVSQMPSVTSLKLYPGEIANLRTMELLKQTSLGVV